MSQVGGGPVEELSLIVVIPSSPEIEAFYPHSEKVTFYTSTIFLGQRSFAVLLLHLERKSIFLCAVLGS